MDQDLDESDERPEHIPCPMCAGAGCSMGFLGALEWFRCQNCGMTFNQENDHE